jgi:hypothetical protein
MKTAIKAIAWGTVAFLAWVAGAIGTMSTASAQELTAFQRQVLGGIKKSLTEYLHKQHANCSVSRVCDIGRVDVLDDVLANWDNTPSYGRCALDVMKWQANLSISIAGMANEYVTQHGALDAAFESALMRRQATDPAFQPPAEYTCRHIFGTPHLYGAAGQDLCKR